MSSVARARTVLLALAALSTTLLIAARPAPAEITDYQVPTQDSGPTSITAGPDGALWFAEFKANQLGRITTGGSFEELALPPQEFESRYVDEIVTGTDGHLWFRFGQADILGRINPSSRALEYYDVPQFGPFAGAPDGKLWFAGLGDAGGLYATDGPQVITIEANGASFKCSGLAPGPDNSMYCAQGAEIRRFDLSTGRLDTFGLGGDSAAEAFGLTAGPDGAIYYTRFVSGGGFVNPVNGSIGRLAPDGSVREWETPDRDIPANIQAGPDGTVWFTLEGSLARVTSDGQFTVAPLPGRFVDSFAFGRDGAVWYADYAANRITRVPVKEVFAEGAGTAAAPKIRSKSLRYRKGKIKVKLTCPAAAECAGKLQIRKRKLKIAKGSYALPAGETRNVAAKTTKKGRALLKRVRTVKVTVELRPTGGGEQVTKKLKLRG